MYARPSGYRYPSPTLRVPDNYSGNAFRDKEQKQEVSEEASQEAESVNMPMEKTEAASEASLLSKRGFGLRLGSLFGKGGSIGTEELLILALILLLADGADGFDDLILFLVILFFIK